MAENEVAVKFSTTLTDKLTENSNALPKGFNKDRFVQNTLSLLNEKPELMKYGSPTIISNLLKGAYLGLDFYSKECYLVAYGSQLNFQLDYRGAKKLAKLYSIRPVKDIYAELVRKGDEFEKAIVDGKQTVNFKPLPFNDEPVIGAFAVCVFEDGGILCDTMSLLDLENTRKSSKASNSPAWKNFTGEMYKKTVLHRLCKHIELSFENPTQRNLFSADMEIETDTEKIVDMEISENANKEEFIDVEAEVVE